VTSGMMRRISTTITIACAALAFAVLTLTSCQHGDAKAPPASNKVHVDAYINVSSGCQAATVELLQKLATQYADRIELTITDFGGDGFAKWHEAGLTCMTILFDGSPAVVVDAPGGAMPIVFQMPAGISWTHEDLEHAFAAAAIGKLRTATEDEIQAANTPKTYALKFSAQESKDLASDKVKFQLLAGGKAVAEITEKDGDRSPKDRAGKAAKVLSDWVANPILLGDLKMEATAPGRIAIIAAGASVLTATEADAKAVGETDPKKIASKWMSAIKGALLAAGDGTRGAETKTGALPQTSDAEIAWACRGAPPAPGALFGGPLPSGSTNPYLPTQNATPTGRSAVLQQQAVQGVLGGGNSPSSALSGMATSGPATATPTLGQGAPASMASTLQPGAMGSGTTAGTGISSMSATNTTTFASVTAMASAAGIRSGIGSSPVSSISSRPRRPRASSARAPRPHAPRRHGRRH
jgi:hypothetical protein